MKIKKIIISVLLIIFCFTCITAYADNELNIIGGYSGKLYFNTDNEYIFHHVNAMPGSEWKTNIHFKNTSKRIISMALTKIINNNSDDILPSNMYLKLYYGNKTLYDGPYPLDMIPVTDSFDIPANDEVTIVAVCGIYGSAGNELQNTNMNTTWIFNGDTKVDKNNVSSSGYSSSEFASRVSPIAIGNYYNNLVEYIASCKDENGNVICTTTVSADVNELYIEAPDIEGYTAITKYISILTIKDRTLNFKYKKNISNTSDNSTDITGDSINSAEFGSSCNVIYDVSDNANNYVAESGTDYMTVNITDRSVTALNYNRISNNSNNTSNTGLSSQNNPVSGSNYTEDGNVNNSGEDGSMTQIIPKEDNWQTLDGNHNENNNSEGEQNDLMGILGNTALLTWWIIVLMLAIIALIVFLVLKNKKSEDK